MNREVFSRTDETIDEWETPLYLFNLLNNYMIDHGYDTFTLDAAASHENHLCEKYYTKEIDGLKQDWKGETVFVNPPYSNINEWVKKCYKEGQKHNTFVALLIPSRTDTKYWHEYCMKASEIRFLKGRISFLINGKKPKGSSNNYCSALIIFTPTNGDFPLSVFPFYHKEKDLIKYNSIGEWF